MDAGLYISEEGVRFAREMFERVVSVPSWHDKKNLSAREQISVLLKKFQKERSLQEDASYDDYYLHFYLLHLAQMPSVRISSSAGKGLSKLFDLSALLRFKNDEYDQFRLPVLSEKLTFEKSLINEFIVADVLYFASSVKELIPYPVGLEQLGLGCISLEFGIYGLGEVPKDSSLPFLSKHDIEADIEHTKSERWRQVKQRFCVEQMQLIPNTQRVSKP